MDRGEKEGRNEGTGRGNVWRDQTDLVNGRKQTPPPPSLLLNASEEKPKSRG